MSNTAIEWTDKVWNPVTGCTKVSQGCKNCYAERVFPRAYGDRPFTMVMSHGDRFETPLSWRKPCRVFVNSMSDLFHEHVSFAVIDELFSVMAAAPRHTFQILTKRPERMLEYMTFRTRSDIVWDRAMALTSDVVTGAWPLPNVWLGVSCEDQKTADERIPLLLQTPAAVRWISAEPLLGPIDLDSEKAEGVHALGCGHKNCECGDRGLDWVVVGGESGPHARPMHLNWPRELRDQCKAAGVPFFFKQWGEYSPTMFASRGEWVRRDGAPIKPPVSPKEAQFTARVGKKAAGRLLDGREWSEYPEVSA